MWVGLLYCQRMSHNLHSKSLTHVQFEYVSLAVECHIARTCNLEEAQ